MSAKRKAPLKNHLSVEALIKEIREQKVILDSDLACIYGVTTSAFNQAIKRNRQRFPKDFMFKITKTEWDALNLSQIVTGSQRHRDVKKLPRAFTEHGAIMAATVLNSSRAVQMSLFVVRAFVRMRTILLGNKELAEQLAALITGTH